MSQAKSSRPPFKKKILFQGDSITNAFRMPQETNSAFQMGAGYAMLVASHYLFKYPERGYEFLNRGVSGDCVLQLKQRWISDTLGLYPDLLSILIGVNDCHSHVSLKKKGFTLKDFQRDYTDLLEHTRKALPRLQLVLMEPFILEVPFVTRPVLKKMKEDLRERQQIAKNLAKRFDALWIPLQAPFNLACSKAAPVHWIYDGIHPCAAGFQLIANEWIKQVDPVFQ